MLHLFLFLLGAATLVLRGWLLHVLWPFLMTPAFGLASPGLRVLVGLSLMWTLFHVTLPTVGQFVRDEAERKVNRAEFDRTWIALSIGKPFAFAVIAGLAWLFAP